MIKEVIVVEGRDDVSAVKMAVDADIIVTSGFGINYQTMEKIKNANKTRGVIIFTDPDSAGERIRKYINERVEGCKQAYLPRNEATKNGDIGIENASPESIRAALSKVKTEVENCIEEFSIMDMVNYRLTECSEASMRRSQLGSILGIGYGNAKQMLSRLNRYGVTREEFNKAVMNMDGKH